MERAGFRCIAAIDCDAEAITTFRQNFPHVPHTLKRDLQSFRPQQLAELLGCERVDVVAGGPPCQGYSTARQRDGANHGSRRFVEDPRRQLYREFLAYVGYFQPRFFVMENVLGLRSAAGGDYFTRVQHEARLIGYRVVPHIADAFELGVPQKRRRQLIIGFRKDIPGLFPNKLTPAPRAIPHTQLGPAIGDLPEIHAGSGSESAEYDFTLRRKHLAQWGKPARNYLYRVLEISRSKKLTAHRARPHSDRDLRDFRLLREGETSATLLRQGVQFEFPYDKLSFKDRYTRQSRYKPCSTIVAHLSKDGLMFIHPTQNRSLTPREAARIQSFPDWFLFRSTRTHQFRLIGNAVPPLVSEAVGLELMGFLSETGACVPKTPATSKLSFSLPRNRREAARTLQQIARLDRRQLRACSRSDFVNGWRALLFLFPDLHPKNALDHGNAYNTASTAQLSLPGLEQFELQRFERSGWPVALEAIGHEAWRRLKGGTLSEAELYCSEAQRAGLKAAKCKIRTATQG